MLTLEAVTFAYPGATQPYRFTMEAAPGQTLVSSSVAALCGHRRLADVGELALKGFLQSVRAHAVVEDG